MHPFSKRILIQVGCCVLLLTHIIAPNFLFVKGKICNKARWNTYSIGIVLFTHHIRTFVSTQLVMPVLARCME